MKPVIQEDENGCGFACVAVLADISYAEVRDLGNRLGIYAEDERLYSDTSYVRTLLLKFNIEISETEQPFK